MILDTGRAIIAAGRRHTAGVIALAVVLGGFGLTGCQVVTAVNKVRHDVASNKAMIDEFTNTMKSSAATTFEATYVTTGSTPTTVVYAVKPPQGLSFTNAPASGSAPSGSVDLVVNSSGEYSCSPPSSSSGSGSKWSCRKLGTASAAAQNQIFAIYTPAHWVVFLRDFALAAGFAGDKVTSYSTSPPASLFELPPGATVTAPPSGAAT